MANLISNTYQKGGKVLLLDATGEYANLPCEHYYVGKHPNATNQNTVTYPHWMFTDSDIRALLRPSAQSQAPKLNAAINSLKILENVQGHNLQVNTNGNLVKSQQKKEPFYQAERNLGK